MYQVVRLSLGEGDRVRLGNVNVFRDWSHVQDIVQGYILVATRGRRGDVYNLGSRRTNSMLTYLLLALQETGYRVHRLSTMQGRKVVEGPAAERTLGFFGVEFPGTRVDELLLLGEVAFEPGDEGLLIETDRGMVPVTFDPERFRPSDVPILLCDPSKAEAVLGFEATRPLQAVVRDQVDYFLSPRNRMNFIG